MTTKASFNAEEWAVITTAPYLAGMVVVAADRGGTVRETIALSEALRSAREYYDDGLLQEIVATPPALPLGAAPRSSEDLHREATDAVRRAVAALGRVATEDELNNYKRFVFYVAETVASAHREGGFLGLGGTEVSEREQEVLDDIAAILDAPHPGAPPSSA
ncbi:MAG TPA: hypothetical protein VE992_02825 [Solirubrobacteraceae bacterium]|nr:hypothetical protein [Solirubrobacteraceae bacterium]